MKGRSRKKEGSRWLLPVILCLLAAGAGAGFWAWRKGAGAISEPSGEDEAEMAFFSGGAEFDPVVIRIEKTDENSGSLGDQEEPQGKETVEDGQEESSPEEEKKTIRLAFAGDVLLSNHVLSAYQSGGGIDGVVGESLLRQAEEADLFMVNQEFPFSSRGTPAEDKQFTFRLSPEYVSLFHEMGIDLVTLANNHALDFGTDALLDTCHTLDQAGIPYVGAGENLEQAKALYKKQIGEWTVGFLGATRVIPVGEWAATDLRPGMLSTYDPTVLLEEIRKGKEACDYLVVYVHWGVEREEYPKDYQRQLGQQFLEAGADLVIGSHPHVLQGIEYYKGKPIVYSLGNFVFGSSIPKSLLLQAEWDGEKTELTVIPATSSAGYTREIQEEGQREEWFQYLEQISFDVKIDEYGRVYPVESE